MDLGPVVTIAGWVVGPVVGGALGVKFERARVRSSDRAQSRRAAVRAALNALSEVDSTLRAIEAGYRTPPRSQPAFTIDAAGRVSGFTESPGIANYTTETALARLVETATEGRGRLVRAALERRLVRLCGRVAYDLRLAGSSQWLGVTALSASWGERRPRYAVDDATGLLSVALTEGATVDDARRARTELSRLYRIIDR